MTEKTILAKAIHWFIQTFGYENVIGMKDTLLFVAGVLLGGLVMVLLVGKFIYKVEKVEQMGKITSVTFKKDKKTVYITRVNTFFQAVEFVILVTLSPILRKSNYTLEDNSRTSKVVYLVVSIIIILIIFCLFLVFHPILLTD